MVEQLPTEEYNQEAVDAFANAGKPIPGQSLTASPDEVRPFEGPPQFTEFREALNFIVEELLEEEAYLNLVASIADGVPIIDMVMQIGYVREGKWNPDLMVMLIEPLMYLLMALCEKAGVEYRIDDEDDDDDDEATILQEKSENIARVAKAKMAKTNVIPKGVLTKEIETKLETLEVPQQGLLDRQEPSPEPQSLLNRGQ